MKITNVRVYGLEDSIVASGYPMLNKPLTEDDFQSQVYGIIEAFKGTDDLIAEWEIKQVEKDIKHIKRATRLAQAPSGSGHDCWLKGVIVQMDVNAPQYFWQQLQRYHFIDFVSSMSKMHRIDKLAENFGAFNETTDSETINTLISLIRNYKDGDVNIDTLLCNVPMGLEYTARMTTNYLQLKTIYKQRRQHRSQEWQEFCNWIETLPLAKELIIGETFKNELHYTGNGRNDKQ